MALSATAAQYLGMAFYELCTNAVKHGAFSVPEVRVRVRWTIGANGQEDSFKIAWTEKRTKAVGSKAQGFGWKVLREITPWALSGSAEIETAADGLRWSLTAPAHAVISRFQTANE